MPLLKTQEKSNRMLQSIFYHIDEFNKQFEKILRQGRTSKCKIVCNVERKPLLLSLNIHDMEGAAGFLLHIMSTLVAYTFRDEKPSISMKKSLKSLIA